MRLFPSSLQAVEAAQLAEDLKVQLEHTQAKLKEIQVSVAENRTARERESSNLKRAQVCMHCECHSKSKALIGGCRSNILGILSLQEDLSRLRRKLEKQKKVEMYSDADEILQEEINQYKVRKRRLCAENTNTPIAPRHSLKLDSYIKHNCLVKLMQMLRLWNLLYWLCFSCEHGPFSDLSALQGHETCLLYP